MQAEFWLQHWQQGRTGFHRDAPQPALSAHWPALAPGSRVLVPLAGKSLDMLWLAQQGYRVLGVELSPLAVQQFLDSNRLSADRHDTAQGLHHVSDNIEIIQGDIFDLQADTLASCDAIYDRAAMITLPAAMRARYIRHVYDQLPDHCRGLLITLEYAQTQMAGPPFSVSAPQAHTLLGPRWHIDPLTTADVLASNPGLQAAGLTALHSAVYALRRQPQ